MSQIGHLKALVVMTKKNRRTYFLESLQAIGYVLLFTILLFVSHLYPRIHYITLMYVLIVGILAFRYGHFVAVVAAIASYICLDFFLFPLFIP